ncbi:hypothetical protein A3D11_00830 [Candidatus Peribacteria bacterium RIFCSPHIGHO2_02_FULL_49_16]|nr:MAG: hypothetical protein A2880_01305 [Candidatus Peribacteria bacterium RIFCSPHIGHO2_01_FULL_49_38]OGJ60071.1 MAG: hypothetical protein A3D11_00830 [Candidatus Peribacteria bacterium RIFCSPHIGHO2_02_FULL_49_16]
MLHLDISTALAKVITSSFGVTNDELMQLRTSMKRYIEEWLKEREKGGHTWSMDPYNKTTVDRVKEIANRIKKEKVQTVVWIGIGGSGLGPKVIQEVFETPSSLEFLVIDTIDPALLQTYLHIIDWKCTCLIVASKSGGTLETMSVFFLFWEELKKALGKRANERVFGITDKQSGVLRDFCLEQNIEMLFIPSEVGGRFSIFTPVGLLPFMLLSDDIDEFLHGAKEMDTLCQQTTLEDNPAALLASMQYILDTKRDMPVRVIMPYSQRLQSIARWNQQLIAESLGKTELSNPIPLAAIGTHDQHSLLQQWMAGPRKCWHIFIRDADKPVLPLPSIDDERFSYIKNASFGELLDACYEGTSQALSQAKRPHITITLPQLDAYHLGQLFFFFLTEVVLLGKIYRIDPYGQPAVEIGKTLTKEILSKNKISRMAS